MNTITYSLISYDLNINSSMIQFSSSCTTPERFLKTVLKVLLSASISDDRFSCTVNFANPKRLSYNTLRLMDKLPLTQRIYFSKTPRGTYLVEFSQAYEWSFKCTYEIRL